MKTVLFALTVLFVWLVPLSGVLLRLLGLERFGHGISPSAFIAAEVLTQLGISYIAACLIVSLLKLEKRIPPPIPGKWLIWIGGVLLLMPACLRIGTSMIQGGGATYAMFTLLAPATLIGKVMFFVGLFLLLLAIKPDARFSYPE